MAAFQPRIISASLSSLSAERFFVEVRPGEVQQYEVSKQGALTELLPSPQPIALAVSSVEKFGAGYLVEPPVVLANLQELTTYVGRLKPLDDTHCTL